MPSIRLDDTSSRNNNLFFDFNLKDKMDSNGQKSGFTTASKYLNERNSFVRGGTLNQASPNISNIRNNRRTTNILQERLHDRSDISKMSNNSYLTSNRMDASANYLIRGVPCDSK